MKTLRATLKRSILGAATRRTASQWARSLFATFLAALLAGGPLFAQTPAQNPPSNPAPTPTTAADGSSIAPVSSLGLTTHNYTHGPSGFPNIIKPYMPIHVDQPMLINSPRLDQLVHDGKLELTLQDAVELALENSMDIAVQRYYPWMADAGILNAKSGLCGLRHSWSDYRLLPRRLSIHLPSPSRPLTPSSRAAHLLPPLLLR